MLEMLFLVITTIASLITVFSVISNLSIFIEQHAVEMNILRAIGFTARQVLWTYEMITFAIVASPLCLGILSGILISFIICKQEAMIIDIPLGFSVSIPISLKFAINCSLTQIASYLYFNLCSRASNYNLDLCKEDIFASYCFCTKKLIFCLLVKYKDTIPLKCLSK